MLTTSHGIIGYLLFKNKGKAIWVYSIIGSIVPDIPIILSSIVYITLGSISANHEALHNQFIDKLLSPITHSIFLWVGVFLLLFFVKKKLTKWKIFALGVGGISHIVIDLLTHQGKWTWNHLYPLNIDPIEGLFYYLNPYFIITVHVIWLIIFGPSLYIFFKNKFNKGD